MLIEFQNEPFGCLKNFDYLRRWQIVIVGDTTDARIALFLFKARVLNNWPSPWHSTRYKAGYIRLEIFDLADRPIRGKPVLFDLAKQTIEGKQVFLFLFTHLTEILWRRQTLEDKIKDCVDKMAPRDKFAAHELVRELADPRVRDPRLRRFRFPEALRALSLSQLEALAELFAMPGGDQKADASLAAA